MEVEINLLIVIITFRNQEGLDKGAFIYNFFHFNAIFTLSRLVIQTGIKTLPNLGVRLSFQEVHSHVLLE